MQWVSGVMFAAIVIAIVCALVLLSVKRGRESKVSKIPPIYWWTTLVYAGVICILSAFMKREIIPVSEYVIIYSCLSWGFLICTISFLTEAYESYKERHEGFACILSGLIYLSFGIMVGYVAVLATYNVYLSLPALT